MAEPPHTCPLTESVGQGTGDGVGDSEALAGADAGPTEAVGVVDGSGEAVTVLERLDSVGDAEL